MQTLSADIAIIGAGSAGLAIAAGAAQMGARVVLFEKHRMGGDCLNTGCVPSKALIAAADAAETVRRSGRFGVNGHEPEIDFARVHAHVHGVIGAIAPHDSVERFRGLGVKVIEAAAKFVSPTEIEGGGVRVGARRFVVATGSRAAVPPIPGLAETPFLTNETIFELTERPQHLIVIGGGPIGAELAQAHRRLGAQVSVIEAMTLLSRDDPEAVEVVRARLRAEGVALHERTRVDRVGRDGNTIELTISAGGRSERLFGTHLLIATGRTPVLDGLGLEAAGIAHTPRGITVDARLRTSNRRVFAVGDVAGGPQFTHVAGYQAGIVIRNALFHMPAKADLGAVPAVTFTDPEIARVGLSEEAAKVVDPKASSHVWRFVDNDRARAECETEGLVKAVIGRGGRILGASIVGRHAGELILPWVLAVEKKLKAADMASIIAPYPTLSEASKRAAGASFTGRLFSDRTRAIVRLMQRLP